MTEPVKPSIGDVFSRQEISSMFGGSSQPALPNKNGEVVSGCFNPKKNPNAPIEILVEAGPNRVKYSKILAKQVSTIPVFIKRANKKFEFIGYFRGKKYSDDPSEVHQKSAGSSEKIVGILYLEQVDLK